MSYTLVGFTFLAVAAVIGSILILDALALKRRMRKSDEHWERLQRAMEKENENSNDPRTPD